MALTKKEKSALITRGFEIIQRLDALRPVLFEFVNMLEVQFKDTQKKPAGVKKTNGKR